MISKKERVPIALFPRSARTIFRNTYVTLKASPNDVAYNRIGVIIGRATEKSAVKRNRVRRKIFDYFRLHTTFLSKCKIKTGVDLLVIVNPSMMKISDQSFIKELIKIWEYYSTNFYIYRF